jgi:2-keto-4-pentenoate hydratase/2-oxohepta-3-ene-1,7-dioic acid hydratase in catechol pathway
MIVALAYNYKGYTRSPLFFMKRGIIGDSETIYVPNGLSTWIEPELGWRVGSGFVLANDITTDNLDQDVHLAISKCRDTYCPMMDIPRPSNPSNVTLRGYINSELVTEGNTKGRIYDERGAWDYISGHIKLGIGDIVLTGCPPHDRPTVKPGDVCRVEAWEEGKLLGRITNDIRS